MSIASQKCPLCDEASETIDHKVQTIWRKCWSWWKNSPLRIFSIDDAIVEVKILRGLDVKRKVVQGVYYILDWSIWNWGNQIVHAPEERKQAMRSIDIFAQVQRLSLTWISNLCQMIGLGREKWVLRPYETFQHV